VIGCSRNQTRFEVVVTRSCGFLAVVGGVLVSMGCSPAKQSDSCPSFDYGGYAATTDPSFKNEIRPILATSCAQLSCHGSDDTFPAMEPQGHALDLGPPVTEAAPDAGALQQIHDHLVGVKSATAPALDIVAAGDPMNSFLMRKIDGDQGCSGIECPEGCGKRMPNIDGTELDAASTAKIRAWIKQGAKNN
jgi:hypothetical protein